MKFTCRQRYRFGDIDHAGIAYYPKLLHCFHCAFEDWWADGLGRSYADVMRDDDLGLPSVHLDVDFFRQVRYGDELDVHLGILKIGTSSVEFGCWMTKGADPAPLCRARIVTVAVHMHDLSKRELPATWRERFRGFVLADGEFPAGR